MNELIHFTQGCGFSCTLGNAVCYSGQNAAMNSGRNKWRRNLIKRDKNMWYKLIAIVLHADLQYNAYMQADVFIYLHKLWNSLHLQRVHPLHHSHLCLLVLSAGGLHNASINFLKIRFLLFLVPVSHAPYALAFFLFPHVMSLLLTNSVAYGTRRFNAAFTRAL